jgi:hypothetical protein
MLWFNYARLLRDLLGTVAKREGHPPLVLLVLLLLQWRIVTCEGECVKNPERVARKV